MATAMASFYKFGQESVIFKKVPIFKDSGTFD